MTETNLGCIEKKKICLKTNKTYKEEERSNEWQERRGRKESRGEKEGMAATEGSSVTTAKWHREEGTVNGEAKYFSG